MKKAISLVIALVLALSMSAFAFAEDASPVAQATDDIKAVLEELSATVGVDALEGAVNEVIAGLQKQGLLPADLSTVDAGSLEDGTADKFGSDLIAKLNLEDTAIAEQISGAVSNDFVSFIAGLYTGEVVTTPATTVAPATTEAPPVVTGDSATIAIASFAVLSVAAAAMFVAMKKKEA
ncbi:MAG: hypothetical protein LBB67_00805 [Oscillospiraceae bacterium]|jgi:hypothetical protein|nr:hypothetical protein [Oscillospiraceae bacterium]